MVIMNPKLTPTPKPTLAPWDKEEEEGFDSVGVGAGMVEDEAIAEMVENGVIEMGLDDAVPVDNDVWVVIDAIAELAIMFPARSRNTPLPLAQHAESLLQQ
jgi:hypothetical protein